MRRLEDAGRKDMRGPPAQMFAFELILAVLLFYFIYLQLRRLKYRRIARELGAEYESQGPFKTGQIVGASDGRKYTIATRDVAAYKSSSTWTTFSLDCRNRGIPLSLQSRFFKSFPDWKFAFTRGDTQESALGINLALENAPVPLQEKYHPQVQCLFQQVALVDSELLKRSRTRIEIERDAVSYTTHGVLRNAVKARQVISLLTQVATRIEAAPRLIHALHRSSVLRTGGIHCYWRR